MGVRQLEEFQGRGDQKGFFTFSYTQIFTTFGAAVLAFQVLGALWKPLAIPGALLALPLAIIATHKVKGTPVYRWAWAYLACAVRKRADRGKNRLVIDPGPYYNRHSGTQRAFTLYKNNRPVLVHRGSSPHARAPVDLPLHETQARPNPQTQAIESSHGAASTTLDPELDQPDAEWGDWDG